MLCCKRDFCSGNEEPGFSKPSARASGLGKPPSLSEQAPLTLLRLIHISPILGLANAGKDFSFFFFSPQQKAYLPGPKPCTAKVSFDNSRFWAFLLKTKLSLYFTFYFFRQNSWKSRPSWNAILCKSERFIFNLELSQLQWFKAISSFHCHLATSFELLLSKQRY